MNRFNHVISSNSFPCTEMRIYFYLIRITQSINKFALFCIDIDIFQIVWRKAKDDRGMDFVIRFIARDYEHVFGHLDLLSLLHSSDPSQQSQMPSLTLLLGTETSLPLPVLCLRTKRNSVKGLARTRNRLSPRLVGAEESSLRAGVRLRLIGSVLLAVAIVVVYSSQRNHVSAFNATELVADDRVIKIVVLQPDPTENTIES